MDTTKNIIIDMFNECGLNMQGMDLFRRSLNREFVLPKKTDFDRLMAVNYDKWDEETKIRTIKWYIYNKYHFRMSNWEFFLPNVEFDSNERNNLTLVFDSIKLHLTNEKINVYLQSPFLELLQIQLKNKDFLKTLSKEFQLKSVFSTKETMLKKLKIEMANLIENKIMSSGFKEKLDVELPKLIMKDLEKIV